MRKLTIFLKYFWCQIFFSGNDNDNDCFSELSIRFSIKFVFFSLFWTSYFTSPFILMTSLVFMKNFAFSSCERGKGTHENTLMLNLFTINVSDGIYEPPVTRIKRKRWITAQVRKWLIIFGEVMLAVYFYLRHVDLCWSLSIAKKHYLVSCLVHCRRDQMDHHSLSRTFSLTQLRVLQQTDLLMQYSRSICLQNWSKLIWLKKV